MLLSEIKYKAQQMINGHERVETVALIFAEAAESLKFKHLLEATEDFRDLSSASEKNEAISNSERKIMNVAHYVVGHYDELSYQCLNTLIDLAHQYLGEKKDIIDFATQIYDLAYSLDIDDICGSLMYVYWEAAEIVKPEETKHLYSQDLLDSFSVQIKALEKHIEAELDSICKLVIARYTREEDPDAA